MGNEVSEMAADAITAANMEEANLEDVANCLDPSGGLEDMVQNLQLDDADPDEYANHDEDLYYEEGSAEYDTPGEEDPDRDDYYEDGDYGGGDNEYAYEEDEAGFVERDLSRGEDDDAEYDEYYDEEVFSDDLSEANQEDVASLEVSGGEEDSVSRDEPSEGYAYNWDDLEIGETEDGLFDEDISGLRSDFGLIGDGGLDIYEGVDPIEPIDWEVEEFYDYNVDELLTATDIELTSLGYPPEPIAGTTTEDIMFSVEMMNESTVPPAKFSPEMYETFSDGASKLLETQNSMVDSIREMRESLA